MNEVNNSPSDTDETSSSENEAATRVRQLMDRIFKKGKDVKSQNEVDQMVEQCSNMLSEIKKNSNLEISRNKPKKPVIHRKSGDRINSKQGYLMSGVKNEFIEGMMSEGLNDLMQAKNGILKFNEIYEKKLSDKKKMEYTSPSKTDIMSTFGKPSDHSLRKKIEQLMDEDTSDSKKSSGLSSNDSESDEEKMFEQTMSSIKGMKRTDSQEMPRDWFSQSKEEYYEAKNKAREWLKNNDPSLTKGLAMDGWDKTFESLSSSSEDEQDVSPSRKILQKKTEDQIKSLKDKLGMLNPAVESMKPMKSIRTKSSSKTPLVSPIDKKSASSKKPTVVLGNTFSPKRSATKKL